jgi:hypothetical protein
MGNDSKPDKNASVVPEMTEFGANFVSAMRTKSAEEPISLRTGDLVDVFSKTGKFLYRGVVEKRNKSTARIKIYQPTSGNAAKPAKRRAKIENCRHADAAPPPATLSEWETSRGVSSSKAPV